MKQETLHKSKTNLELAHEEQVKVLNLLLTEIMELASVDFLQMGSVLSEFEKAAVHAETVSLAVMELQHVDALRQKLEHIRDFQIGILNGDSALHEDGDEVNFQNIPGLVFKLNYYQVVAAQDDFSNSVRKVQSLMSKIRANESFANLQRIQDHFKNITTTLSFLANEYCTSTDFELSHLSDYFSDRYSMLSERIVLNWCVSSEYESVEDFKKYYSSKDKSESVELF